MQRKLPFVLKPAMAVPALLALAACIIFPGLWDCGPGLLGVSHVAAKPSHRVSNPRCGWERTESHIRHVDFESEVGGSAGIRFDDEEPGSHRSRRMGSESDAPFRRARAAVREEGLRIADATNDRRGLEPPAQVDLGDDEEADGPLHALSPAEVRRRLQPAEIRDDWFVEPGELTAEMTARRARIRQVLTFYYQRPLNTWEDSPWSMMHHMLAWGVDGYIMVGGPGGRQASVIGWLCSNGACEGESMLRVVDGRLVPRVGNGLQGHDAQFLALLAQTRVSADQVLRVGQYEFTIKDLMAYEQQTCRSGNELTFKLMGLVHYLHTDYTWVDNRGESWDFPRLMDEEIRAPVNGVTCGGTHRLMALSYAVRRRIRDGLPVTGIWERAGRHVASYQKLAFQLQNSDGSLSSDFFRKRGSWGDPDRKLKTTGHILEWLIFSLPHSRLTDRHVTSAVDYLCNLLIQNRHFRFGKGPLGHGIRALSLYEERMFGTYPGTRSYPPRQPTQPRTATESRTHAYPMRRGMLAR